MPTTAPTLAALQRLLDESAWLGAEVDLQYRVLALTVEAAAGRHPDPATDDRRLQVLLSPTSVLRASLRVDATPPRVESFEVEQLPDVVAAMDAPVLSGQMVGAAEPDPAQWPADSLAGRSNAPDGLRHRVRLEAVTGDRRLGLFVTFDEVEVRRPDGSVLDLG